MAKLIDISYQAWQGYEQGANKPGFEVLQSLARLGFNVNWILTGEGPMYRGEIEAIKPRGSHEDYVLIPVVAGGLMQDNIVETPCVFHREWLRGKGDPDQMSLTRVTGDSMAPTLLHNDLVLVNHAIKAVHDGHIYAISIDDEILVKRLYKDYKNNLIEVRSDNTNFKSFSIEPEKVNVNGKVIWYAREIS